MARFILIFSLFSTLTIATTSRAEFTFDDIEVWVGSGDNEAAFVVDWNDGVSPQSLAWGYRWDGTATGEDMFRAVVMADVNLFARIGVPGGFGTPVFGMGYDMDGDGFAISDGTLFTNGIALTSPADATLPSDADDHYQEGWASNGFWGYWGSTDGLSWAFPGAGMTDRILSNGDWDGWSFAPAFDSTEPSEPVAAVPEPASLALIAIGALAFTRRRR